MVTDVIVAKELIVLFAKTGRDFDDEHLLFGVVLQAPRADHLILLAVEVQQHFFDIHVRATVRRSTVDVVPVLVLIENEHADVRHGTQIDEVDDLIGDDALIDEDVREVLQQGYTEARALERSGEERLYPCRRRW